MPPGTLGGAKVPAVLIECKRLQLMIERKCRENAEELRDELAQTFAQLKAGESSRVRPPNWRTLPGR